MLGVVFLLVDAVDNSVQLKAALRKDTLQPVGIEGVEYLSRIGFADGGDGVGRLDTALHKVHAVAVHNNGARPVRQAEDIAYKAVAVLTLKLYVMDGKHGFDMLILLGEAIEHVEEHGSKRGMPVVCVQNVGEEINKRKHLENGF